MASSIIDGIHPHIRKPYSWHGSRSPANVARSELPETDEAEIRALVDRIIEMLVEKFGFQQPPPRPKREQRPRADRATAGEHESVDVERELSQHPLRQYREHLGPMFWVPCFARVRQPTSILTRADRDAKFGRVPATQRGTMGAQPAVMMTRYFIKTVNSCQLGASACRCSWQQCLFAEGDPALVWRGACRLHIGGSRHRGAGNRGHRGAVSGRAAEKRRRQGLADTLLARVPRHKFRYGSSFLENTI